MARIVAVSNQKGGVGKTTTTLNLGAALAERDLRVLVIDLDPQGNASSGLGVPKSSVDGGVYDVLLHGHDVRDEARVTAVEGLELLPACNALVGAEVELSAAVGRERRLHAALTPARSDYDFVLIDCPPSLGLLTLNAFVAADGVLTPLQAEYYALEGLGALLETMAEVRRWLNPHLAHDGVLLTLMDRRTNLGCEVEAEARQVLGDRVLDTVIPRNVRLAEAPSHGQAAVSWAPSSRGAVAYQRLADELLRRHGQIARGVA